MTSSSQSVAPGRSRRIRTARFKPEELPLLFEEWRPVVGYDGVYSVSNLGRIRRDGRKRGARAGRILQPTRLKGGYLAVHLHGGGEVETAYVHHLVLAAFGGERESGHWINHIDGTKQNNQLRNLEYVTPQQNARHAIAAGLFDPVAAGRRRLKRAAHA